MSECLPGAKRLQLLDMCAGVPGVVHKHRAIDQTRIHVVTVVQTPAAAPHRFTCIIGLNYRIGQQTATHKHCIHHMTNSIPISQISQGEFNKNTKLCMCVSIESFHGD